MTVYFRQPYLLVKIDGQPIVNGPTQGVFGARVGLGYDLQTSEATIQVPVIPSWAKKWSLVQIEMGATEETSVVRFAGYLIQTEYTLYPREVRLVCRGYLIKASLAECTTLGGVDMSAAGVGQADETQILAILGLCGLGAGVVTRSIQGTGVLLGDIAPFQFTWIPGQSGLAYIQALDAICLGYRTFDSVGGTIFRRQITATPSLTPVLTFTEGVDIFRANKTDTILGIKNRITVSGWNDGTNTKSATVEQANPNLDGYITQQLSSAMIERSASLDAGAGLSCEDVGKWLLGELNREIHRCTLTTPRDDLITPGITIAIIAPVRLGTAENYWVQHVETSIDQNGQFNQVLTCLTGQGGNAPILTSPTADFAITVSETIQIISGGVQAPLYIIACQASILRSSAPISTYAWTASGGNPATGANLTFVTTVSSLTGTITLVVTDTNGLQDTIVKNIPTIAQQVFVSRPLYLSGAHGIEASDGTVWHYQAIEAAAVANGPIWAANTGTLKISADYLATAPTSSNPLGATAVTAAWAETNIDPLCIFVGGADGRLALSRDGGATWAVGMRVWDELPILRCALDRRDFNHWYALTASVLWESYDAGAHWRNNTGAEAGETFQDFILLPQRFMIAMSGGRLLVDSNVTQQTFPVLNPVVSNILAVTGNAATNTIWCYDHLGRTFSQEVPGFTFTQMTGSLPGTAVPQIRGLVPDVMVQRLLYFAAGTDGVYMSLDGFASAGGYVRLAQPGIGVSPANQDYNGVGVDGLLTASSGVRKQVVVCGAGPAAYYTPNILTTTPVWIAVSTGLPGSGIAQRIRLDPLTAGRAFLRVDQTALYRNTTIFSGGSWAAVLTKTSIETLTGGAKDVVSISDFMQSPADGIIYVTVTTEETSGGTPHLLHRFWLIHSHDGGNTWTAVEYHLPGSPTPAETSAYATDSHSVAVGQHVAGTVYCTVTSSESTGLCHCYRSFDGGTTVTIVYSTNQTNSSANQVVLPTSGNSNDREVMLFWVNATAVGTTPKRSTDGGAIWANWGAKNAYPHVVYIKPGDSYFAFSYVTAILTYYSNTRGQTWAAVSNPPILVLDAAMYDKPGGWTRHYGVGVVASSKSVVTSEDFDTWTDRTGNLSSVSLFGIDVDKTS